MNQLQHDLKALAKVDKAEFYPTFFKDKSDIWLGVTVPNCRSVAQKYPDLSLNEIQDLLKSKIHEERLVGLMILVHQFDKGDEGTKRQIFEFYLANTTHINNWDLVDLSCYKIVGEYLLDKPRDILYKLAKSDDLWERRIAIVSTMTFIRKKELDDTLKISELLLGDREDLIHKAVGWLLREVGKKDEAVLIKFLKQHYSRLPRTTLRYAIERFDPITRRNYLKGKF